MGHSAESGLRGQHNQEKEKREKKGAPRKEFFFFFFCFIACLLLPSSFDITPAVQFLPNYRDREIMMSYCSSEVDFSDDEVSAK